MKAGVLIRLAIVNVTGFSASTIMPLWLGGIAQQFHKPPWFAGAAVMAQLGGAAAFNLATPYLFGRAALLPLARVALLVAAAAYLLAITHSPTLFLAACLICGAALGTVLNVTNRLMGSAEHVQRGYAIFVIVEVCLATLLFLSGAALIGRFGLLAVFPAVSAMAVIGCALLIRLRIEPSLRVTVEARPRPAHGNRAILCLAAFALFFIGLATLNSFMPTIGQAGGLPVERARQVIGFGMPAGFAGAILARLVGERLRPVVPITGVVLVLACLAPLLTVVPTFGLFAIGITVLAASTIFVVPYFFAQLGALDRNGRYAASGPAMMLAGLAIGPSSAVLLNARWGLPAVGAFAAALILLGGVAFAVSARPAGRPTRRDGTSF